MERLRHHTTGVGRRAAQRVRTAARRDTTATARLNPFQFSPVRCLPLPFSPLRPGSWILNGDSWIRRGGRRFLDFGCARGWRRSGIPWVGGAWRAGGPGAARQIIQPNAATHAPSSNPSATICSGPHAPFLFFSFPVGPLLLLCSYRQAQCNTLTMTEYQGVLRSCGLRRSKSGNVLAVVNPEN